MELISQSDSVKDFISVLFAYPASEQSGYALTGIQEEKYQIVDSGKYIRPRAIKDVLISENSTREIILPSREVNVASNDWFTILIFLSIILITIVRHSFGKYLFSLFQSIINYPAATRLYREQNISLKQGAGLMEIFYLIVLSLFGFQLMNHFGYSLPLGNFLRFLISMGVIVLFFFVKTTVYSFLGFLNETGPETGEYIFHMKNFYRILGILLLPIVGLTAWAPVRNPSGFLFTGLILTVALYLFTLQRGVIILLKKQFSVFYLFLYLCTLEFLPILLFFKVIQS
jgi:hypothetical protein